MGNSITNNCKPRKKKITNSDRQDEPKLLPESIGHSTLTNPPSPSSHKSAPPPLENKGEICYMNSIVQALSSCLKMKNDLILLKEYNSLKLKQFISLLEALNTEDAQTKFDDFMSSYGWKKEGQQDSFEMMAFFINLIYNELKSEDLENNKNEMTEDIFSEYWKSLVLPCRINMNSRTKCACPTDNKNIINDLALHLPLVNGEEKNNTNYNLEEMISAVLKVDPVDDNCTTCDAKQTLVISLDGDAPRTLCFHIQANKLDMESGTTFKPDYTLDYSFDVKVQNQDYKLVSFVEHLGGVKIGHYVAYRRFEANWFSVNDNFVTKLPEVKKPTEYCQKPYILFYETV